MHDAVEARPNIETYLRFSHRIPFSTEGVFRHDPN
jgi:glutathione S-transferase